MLTKPSPTPAGKGAVNVNSLIPYLPGIGRATFGVYKGGPVIYRRELHY
jgi:MSHA biogenesis protein MshQ